MSIHTILDANGEIVSVVSVPDEETLAANTPADCTSVDGAPPFNDAYYTTGWVEKPVAPALYSTWDVASKTWVDSRSLDEIRSTRWSEIKVARAAADYSPLTVGEHTFDANQESQQKIAGAVQLALIAGSSFTVDWTLTDNTVHTLTQADVIALGVALGQRTAQIYGIARALRTAIDAATTAAEVEAVAWPS